MIRWITLVSAFYFCVTAHAKTHCTIQRESKRDAFTFDKAIYDADVAEQTTVLIRRDGSVLRNFDLGNDMPRLVAKFGVHRAMEKLHGSVMVIFTPADNAFSISTNHFEFNHEPSQVRNDATTFGDPTRALTLFDGVNRLGISCSDDF